MRAIIVGPDGHQRHTTIARPLGTLGRDPSKGPAKHSSQQFEQSGIIDLGPFYTLLGARGLKIIIIIMGS